MATSLTLTTSWHAGYDGDNVDTNTVLGIALIVAQTGWGVAAWKSNRAVAVRQVAHEAKDDERFAALGKQLALTLKA